MVKGLVVTHGRLGEELLATARLVYGDFAECDSLSNDGKSPQALYEEISQLIGAESDVPCVIFVDFFGGSCSLACMRFESTRSNACVISGVNLPMILAFLNKRDEVPFDNLAQEVIARSHDSIKLLDPNEM